VSRDRNLDELIGADTPVAERERLQRAHEMLLEAGPPPELSPKLEEGPTLGMTFAKKRAVKRRAMLLLAAALAVVGVFLAGYAVGNGGEGSPHSAKSLALKGTAIAPHAQATLEVWQSNAGNWPMTLTAVGLPPLREHRYYEVYLVRHGKPWGACGAFRVPDNPQQPVTVTLTAPYTLQEGDSWVVTRPGAGGSEPGQTVLRPAPVNA
jgi:hypothetical protein